jgi:hypothetical protein
VSEIDDSCGCPKPRDCWGRGGQHYRPNPSFVSGAWKPKYSPTTGDELVHMARQACGVAYERCPRYVEAVARNKDQR